MHVRAAAALAAATVAVAIAAPGAAAQGTPVYKDPSAPVNQRVSDLLNRMTPAEKIGQMGQINAFVLMGDPTTPWDRAPFNEVMLKQVLDTNQIGSILSGGGAWPPAGNDAHAWASMVNDIQRYALDHSRLGIPIVYGVDAVHGHNNLSDATTVPHQVGLGATFDPALARRLGRRTGTDVRATGIPWDFAPVLDTERDLRWGRSYEPFGEDPLVNGIMGAATIQGLQGRDLSAPDAVAATAKHFIGYSAPDNGHDRTDATISDSELRRIHLPPFERGIDAGVATAMFNSGSVNGVPGHANKHLDTDVLRDQLGFRGVAVSDWQDVENLMTKYHLVPDDRLDQAYALAVNAGMDMSMIPLDANGYTAAMKRALTDGAIKQSRIDQAVRRILTLKFKLGLFEHPFADADAANAVVEDPAHRPLATRAARKSLVLLENDGTLPLRRTRKGGRLLVTGPSADNPTNQLGGWSVGWQGAFDLPDDVPVPPTTTVLEGIEHAAPGNMTVAYRPGAPADPAADPDDPAVAEQREAAVSAARRAKAVVVAVGEKPYAETPGDNDAPALPAVQRRLVDELAATGTPVILVVVAGRPLVMNRELDEAAASLMAFLPGSEGGTAIASVLFGRSEVAGRLTVSWPRTADQFPLAYNEGGAYAPRYAFGYGKSYGRYAVTELRMPGSARRGEDIDVVARVHRRGGVARGEYTALAFAQPAGGGQKQLIGFAREAFDGANARIHVDAETDALAPGAYRVTVGGTSERLVVR
jgi:beta-glucosidase